MSSPKKTPPAKPNQSANLTKSQAGHETQAIMSDVVDHTPSKIPTTKSQARPRAEHIVSDVLRQVNNVPDPSDPNSQYNAVKPQNSKASSVLQNKLKKYPTPAEVPSSVPKSQTSHQSWKGKDQPRKSSSFLFHTPPEAEEEKFVTPPLKSELELIYQAKKEENSRAWHKAEVEKTMKESRWDRLRKSITREEKVEKEMKINIDDGYSEDIPLLVRDNDLGPQPPSRNGRRRSSKDFLQKALSMIGIKETSYPMSAKFTNPDYRQNFISKMLMYRIFHMLAGYLAAILFQMTWTWEREIQNLGPPDLVSFVADHFWITWIVLTCYLSLATIVRIFHIGRQKPFNYIIFFCFVSMFAFKCYAACVGLGQLGAAIITTVTYTLCLSYGLLSILLTLNKWPEKLDFTKNYIFHLPLQLVLITSPISCMLNFLELKVTGSIFQKKIGTLGYFLEDYLPSAAICYFILLWEVYRIRRIMQGVIVSLPDGNEYLYGAFFI